MDVNPNIKSLSECKFQLKIVVRNLRKLEEVGQSGRRISGDTSLLITETNAGLDKLENSSMVKFKRLVEKRKKLRSLKKAKKKREQTKIEINRREFESNMTFLTTSSNRNMERQETNRKSFHSLRHYNDAKQFLHRIELIKLLHFERTQDAAVSQQFDKQFEHLENTWRNILQANSPVRSNESKMEDQWLNVFFGAKEHKRKIGKHKTADFVRIREIWDSYLMNNRQGGSSIPIGWVLPPRQPDDRWLPYCAPN